MELMKASITFWTSSGSVLVEICALRVFCISGL